LINDFTGTQWVRFDNSTNSPYAEYPTTIPGDVILKGFGVLLALITIFERYLG